MTDFAAKHKYKIGGDSDWHIVDLIDEIIDEDALSFSKNEFDDVNLDSFKPNKELNPRIWINGEINSKVRARLLKIADDFIESLDINWVKPVDIILIGSLANYNWSKFSDFDLHVMYDFSEIDEKTTFVKDYFDAKKNAWNDMHDELKIFGYPVEVYVQDINEDCTASGVYSLEDNKWIIEPSQDKIKTIKLNKYFIKEKVYWLMKKIDALIDKDEQGLDAKKVAAQSKKLFDKIKAIRKDALKNGDEMSSGNIIFKVLRRNGYLEKLSDLKTKSYDRMNSLMEM